MQHTSILRIPSLTFQNSTSEFPPFLDRHVDCLALVSKVNVHSTVSTVAWISTKYCGDLRNYERCGLDGKQTKSTTESCNHR